MGIVILTIFKVQNNIHEMKTTVTKSTVCSNIEPPVLKDI